MSTVITINRLIALIPSPGRNIPVGFQNGWAVPGDIRRGIREVQPAKQRTDGFRKSRLSRIIQHNHSFTPGGLRQAGLSYADQANAKAAADFPFSLIQRQLVVMPLVSIVFYGDSKGGNIEVQLHSHRLPLGNFHNIRKRFLQIEKERLFPKRGLCRGLGSIPDHTQFVELSNALWRYGANALALLPGQKVFIAPPLPGNPVSQPHPRLRAIIAGNIEHLMDLIIRLGMLIHLLPLVGERLPDHTNPFQPLDLCFCQAAALSFLCRPLGQHPSTQLSLHGIEMPVGRIIRRGFSKPLFPQLFRIYPGIPHHSKGLQLSGPFLVQDPLFVVFSLGADPAP